MKQIFILAASLAGSLLTGAQELYVFSEPASNMPSNTITLKVKATAGRRGDGTIMQRYTPELMFGFSKNFMVHAATSFSNMMFPSVQFEGAYVYGKYRFLSSDEVHRHFRMAAFAELGISRNPMMFDEVSVRGDNSGVEAGLIATQLINKLAVSATGSFLEVFEQNTRHMTHQPVQRAVNYSLSAGYLILPVEYRNYEQLNFNIYAELLGQRTFGWESYFVDLAPAVQLIFNSNSKLNLGYRFQVSGNAYRSLEKSFLVSFEHTFFNALKKRR
jgi:hypothetical protein